MTSGAYTQGVMGYWTPNIDRFAKDRAVFTDWYGQHKLMATRDHVYRGSRSTTNLRPT